MKRSLFEKDRFLLSPFRFRSHKKTYLNIILALFSPTLSDEYSGKILGFRDSKTTPSISDVWFVVFLIGLLVLHFCSRQTRGVMPWISFWSR